MLSTYRFVRKGVCRYNLFRREREREREKEREGEKEKEREGEREIAK